MSSAGFDLDELEVSFQYLDDLRDSGETNMFGAAAYLQRDLGFDRKESSSVLSAWMRSFSDEPAGVRAAKVLA